MSKKEVWGVVIRGNFKWHTPKSHEQRSEATPVAKKLPEPLAYSIKEACELSSLKRTTIFACIRAGDLRVTRIGRRTLVLASSLREFLGEDAL